MSKVEAATQAQMLLNTPAFKEACERVERDIISRWKQALTADKRELAWCELRGLEAVKTALTNIVISGRMEAVAQEANTAPRSGATQRK